MTGKIAFDFDRAVDEATKLFWKNGYANTGPAPDSDATPCTA
ncbi:hypothetical protein [Nonomuraea rubra]|uniref:Uncharacterized protein n=1 Tax=Nonomuraea rubra TaxID=46180 RepID=A0A7X0TVK4_9ACTN|nr:hypothetical protein [Nonomuraea rubra]MBB6545461.1 hypothetical protein [Nonomuraea rubra]